MSEITSVERQRLMLFYRRRDAAAWLAHLDTMHLFERAFSRASWPIAFSVEAYNPRPMIVFALPVGVGVETLSDPVEVVICDLDGTFDVKEAVSSLNDKLPPGVKIVGYEWVDGEHKSPMARVKAAAYRLEAPGIGKAFSNVYDSGEPILVKRVQKKKEVTVDLRPRLLAVLRSDGDLLELIGGAGSTDHLRVDLLLDALCQFGGLDEEAALGARITRTRVFLDAVDDEKGIIVEMA